MASEAKNWATLPLSRVKTIMRSSPQVSSISPEAIALTAHSAELFISQLVKDAYNQKETNKKSKCSQSKLEYKHLSEVVATSARMAFLQDVLPNKIKVKDFLQITANNSCGREGEADADTSGSDSMERDSDSD